MYLVISEPSTSSRGGSHSFVGISGPTTAMMPSVLRTVIATRYVTPLREGGSLPGLVEADDDGLYVLKFRGAGQGVKALVAEVVGGELGRALGLAVLDFLPGSLPYAPAAGTQPSPEVAAEIVWLDALVTNVDRTPRNPNLLVWHDRVWLIDHGAALYFHHRE